LRNSGEKKAPLKRGFFCGYNLNGINSRKDAGAKKSQITDKKCLPKPIGKSENLEALCFLCVLGVLCAKLLFLV
jgi:hypothetical protein